MSRWTVETDEYVITIIQRLPEPTRKSYPKSRVYVNLGSQDPRGKMLTSGKEEDEKFDRVIVGLYKHMSLAAAYAVIFKLRRWARSADLEAELPGVGAFIGRPSFIEAKFSWYAGCSCGCSCGCILTDTYVFNGEPVDFWVTLKAGVVINSDAMIELLDL